MPVRTIQNEVVLRCLTPWLGVDELIERVGQSPTHAELRWDPEYGHMRLELNWGVLLVTITVTGVVKNDRQTCSIHQPASVAYDDVVMSIRKFLEKTS